MAIDIDCAPCKTLVDCARIARIAINDDDPAPECKYILRFDYEQGMNEIAEPPINPPPVTQKPYPVEKGRSYKFLFKSENPGIVTIQGFKDCYLENGQTESESALKEYEILECNENNARIAGISVGVGSASLALYIIGSTTVAGTELGSVGGFWGIVAGAAIGFVFGVGTYLLSRPTCCHNQHSINQQGESG
jgi:hypothetical protein